MMTKNIIETIFARRSIREYTSKQVSEAELTSFMHSKLARYKVPKRIIFLEALPETSAGKIAKRELEKRVRTLADNT